MNFLYLFILLIIYILFVIFIVKKTTNKISRIACLITLTLIVGLLSNVPIWNFTSKSQSPTEAFGKSWHKGEIINCIENDEVAVITVLESQQKQYYTYKKDNNTYYELKNKPHSIYTSIYTDELADELADETIMIMRYDCPKSNYIYVEAQIFSNETQKDIIVSDSNNFELPYYTTIYDSVGYNTYTVYAYYSLVQSTNIEQYYISINGSKYDINT